MDLLPVIVAESLLISALSQSPTSRRVGCYKTDYQIAEEEKIRAIAARSPEEAFLESTINFEGREYSQKLLMQKFKDNDYEVIHEGGNFFVKIPAYKYPLKINSLSFKYYKTLN